MRPTPRTRIALGLALAGFAVEARADQYKVTNLVSDVAGLAASTDPNLKNPWGVAASATGPFWVSDQGKNLASLYNGAGTAQGLVVSIPAANAGPNGPTGQVFNGNSSDFLLANGKSASFVFDNLNGQISAWNGGSGTIAQVVANNTGAIYTGLAIGQVGNDNVLYAADARGNKVDVFNSSFQKISGTGGSFAGTFADPLLPTGYGVFNAQTIGGRVYVTYDDPANGRASTNGGIVATFDLSGHFLQQLIAGGPGGPIQDPWGVALAPTGFGVFGGDLLVGNKESGQINAFNPTTGAFLGLVATVTNDPTSVNNGLWSLTFGNGGAGGDPNTLYAFAGINNEADGLIVAISAVPEPGSLALLGLGAGFGLALLRRRAGRA